MNFNKKFGRALFVIAFFISLLESRSANDASSAPKITADGFAVPQAGRSFIFPRDHGSHPDFAIEWWYVTGHLSGANKTEYGFQATFFRRALQVAGSNSAGVAIDFGNDQIYLAHSALVNKNSGEFLNEEKFNRAGWDADSATNTLDVRNGNWSLKLMPESGREIFKLNFTVGANAGLTLQLIPKKSLVVFGTNGVSRKAAEPTAASHYLTYSRLAVDGTVTLSGTNIPVTGEAWMDHEFSSSQLGDGQVGWDWLSLQLYDGRELMAYRMRRKNDEMDAYSTVAWVDGQGRVKQIGPDKFTWTTLQRWKSKTTGADYPSVVQLAAENPNTGKVETFIIQPFVVDQELAGKLGGVAYWEGACRVLNAQKKEVGRAYMELTGYGQSLKGRF